MTYSNQYNGDNPRTDIKDSVHDLSNYESTEGMPRKPNAQLTLNDPPDNLSEAIRACFAPLGGVELELPPRDPMRKPPDFE